MAAKLEPVSRDGNGTAHAVVARKLHRCESGTYGCRRFIVPGDLYVRTVAFPGHDALGDTKRPWTMRVCLACAAPNYPTVFEHLGDTIPA